MSETREGWRSYEVYQRMRVRDATALIKPRQLSSDAYLSDPFPLVAILRENYPCYRDWPGNAFWVTRYDDVTSVFTDTANFESRTRAWSCGIEGWGRDLRSEVSVETAIAQRADDAVPHIVERLIREMRVRFDAGQPIDLATEFCARLPFELFTEILGVTATDELARWYFAIQRAAGWEPRSREAGVTALHLLTNFMRAQYKSRTSAWIASRCRSRPRRNRRRRCGHGPGNGPHDAARFARQHIDVATDPPGSTRNGSSESNARESVVARSTQT
jgi:cytochrome P450